MTIFDNVVLVIIGFSLVIGLMRGAVREVFSIVGWFAAFYVARAYSEVVVEHLPVSIPTPTIKMIAAFLITFLVVLLLTSVASALIATLLKSIGLGAVDRLFGGIIGFIRGILIVVILVMLAGMTDWPKDPRWTNAMLSPPFEALARILLPAMPDIMKNKIHFDDAEPSTV